ncbi:MAG: helix-turn-helix domain-containing protein, partial [Dehalococcoidales bacterium]|nr:helix-turn-helix domain-containing protein [Dehalococcoidales bacterium]
QKNIQLTPIESSLLSVLINNKGHVVTHVNLINEIWGSYDPDLVYSLKVHIRRLRQKLEKDPSNPTIILTKIGLGYYFKLPE